MDEMLIAKVLSGDEKAFESLVKMYEKKVYTLALRLTGDTNDAFDMSQEAFLKIYYNLSSFKHESAFSTWLFRLVSNICIDYMRKKNQKKKYELSLENDEAPILQLPDTSYSPETVFEKATIKEDISNALMQLSPEHREILLLRENAGMSYAEIAEALSIEEGTVKSRIARARIQMRNYLLKSGNFKNN